MTPQEVVDCCLQKPGAYLDAPFGPEVTVVKVGRLGDRPGRIFAQVFRLRGQDTVTLCCTEKMGFIYRGLFPEVVVRSYHCPPVQQPYFNTLPLDGRVPDDAIAEMIDHSYEAVVAKLPKYVQRELK